MYQPLVPVRVQVRDDVTMGSSGRPVLSGVWRQHGAELG